MFQEEPDVPGSGTARGWGNWEVKNDSCWYQSGVVWEYGWVGKTACGSDQVEPRAQLEGEEN